MLPLIINKSKFLTDEQHLQIYETKIKELNVNDRIVFLSKFNSKKISQCYSEDQNHIWPTPNEELKRTASEVINKAHLNLMIKSDTLTIEELVILKENLVKDLIKYYPHIYLGDVINAFEMGSKNKLPDCSTIFSLPNFHLWIEAYINWSRPIINKITKSIEEKIQDIETKIIDDNSDAIELEFEKKQISLINELEQKFEEKGFINHLDIGNVLFKFLWRKKIITNISSKEYHDLYLESIEDRIYEIERKNKEFMRNEMEFRILDTDKIRQSILNKKNIKEVDLVYIEFHKKALNHFLFKAFSDHTSEEYIRLKDFVINSN